MTGLKRISHTKNGTKQDLMNYCSTEETEDFTEGYNTEKTVKNTIYPYKTVVTEETEQTEHKPQREYTESLYG